MRYFSTLAVSLALAMPMAANAAPTLIAIGSLGGTTDLSGKSDLLEDGVNRQNTLGGMGSGFAYLGGTAFLAVPDRGPNATGYDPKVDSTTSYISRFHTMTMQLLANPNAGNPGALPMLLTPQLDATTLLYSTSALNYGTGAGLGPNAGNPNLPSGNWINTDPGKNYFTGRSDNFGAGNSLADLDARFDPESIRVSGDGKTVFISDEYGPYIRQFDRATGALVKTIALPASLAIANKYPTEAAELNPTNNTSGRTTNKGMEGLAITPDGKTLVGIMQAATIDDNAAGAGKLLRIVTVNIETGETHEYGYRLKDGSGVSDIVALNDHQFLVDERDGKGLGDGTNASVKQLFLIDINGAKDIIGLNGKDVLDNSWLVTKTVSPFLDIVSALGANGIGKSQVPAKIEGIAFGYDVNINGTLTHTLWVTNDNDYVPGTAGSNNFYVFGFTDADLPAGFKYGVPEPATWALMIGGFTLAGAAMRGRTASVRFAS